MKKWILLAAFAAVLPTWRAAAQRPVYTEGPKVEGRVAHAFRTGEVSTLDAEGRLGVRRIGAEKRVEVIINAEDAQAVADRLAAEGVEATTVGGHVVTARLTQAEVDTLAARADVYTVSLPRQLRPLLKVARDSTHATEVQAGTGLETPYDGTGVLVAVIDQGFYPRHLAFYDADGKTRIKQWWNRYSSSSTKPASVLPTGGDGASASGGHGTHVANIAAGQNVGNDLQGIAPGASLYMLASSFQTSELMNDVETIAKYAKAQGMPYVINMSFGTQMGPHDGTGIGLQTIDNTLQTYGGFVCAAMGNEGGQRIHTKWAFTGEDQTRAFIVASPTYANSGSNTYIAGQVWEQATGGTQNVTFQPFYVTSSTAATRRVALSASDLSSIGYYEDAIDSYNGKHYAYFYIDVGKLATLANYTGARFGIAMTGAEGDSIHAWLEPDYGTFATATAYLTGDDAYLTSEGAATIPHAIAVGAYTTSNSWYSMDQQQTLGYTSYTKGAIGSYSSEGPWLGSADYPKPTLVAPGSAIESAMSQYDGQWNSMRTYYATQEVSTNGKSYFYGTMTGTSMSTPMVTGAVALWLQANPELTYEQMMDIIQTTARHDKWAKNTWDATYGYGKLDVYAGLKRALEFKAQSAINTAQVNGTQPLTLQREPGCWKILFNDNESYADLALYDAAGRCLTSRQLTGVKVGQEEIVRFDSLAPGTYIVKIRTTGATYSRKMLVR